MTDYRINKIRNFTKLDHKHHCAVALKAKDVGNFIRHYLYLRSTFAGEFRYDESLTGSIVRLTKWTPKVITNAIARLKKDGEIERVKANLYRLNPDISNRHGYTFTSRYAGLSPSYSKDQLDLITALEKEIKHTRSLPQNQTEMDQLQMAEEEEIENMAVVAAMKVTIENLEERVERQNTTLERFEILLKKILDKVEVPNEVRDEVKRHLTLVTAND